MAALPRGAFMAIIPRSARCFLYNINDSIYDGTLFSPMLGNCSLNTMLARFTQDSNMLSYLYMSILVLLQISPHRGDCLNVDADSLPTLCTIVR